MLPKHAANGCFSKPTGFFSQISNQILRDPSLSLKAKGLYSLIFSYITLPNFTLYKDYLKSQCSEGRCAFDSAWKELVAAGYLKHIRTRQPDGTFSYSYFITSAQAEATQAIDQQPEQKSKDALLPTPNPAPIKKIHSEHSVHTEHTRRKSSSSISPKSIPLDFHKIKSSNLNFPIIVSPPPENQTPVSYIYNNTIHKNTKSVSNLDTDLLNNLKNQIDYDYFLYDTSLPKSHKLVVSIILDYLLELSCSNNVSLENLAKTVDSCVINEFLEHMALKKPEQIKYPLPYWKKAFTNFLKESALSIMAI